MMENLVEKQISREEIYNGIVLKVVRDEVLLPNGKEAVREFCMHLGAVAVIPILDDGRVIMERQYRYAHGRIFFEIPAGKLDSKEEEPLDAAKRECERYVNILKNKNNDFVYKTEKDFKEKKNES